MGEFYVRHLKEYKVYLFFKLKWSGSKAINYFFGKPVIYTINFNFDKVTFKYYFLTIKFMGKNNDFFLNKKLGD